MKHDTGCIYRKALELLVLDLDLDLDVGVDRE